MNTAARFGAPPHQLRDIYTAYEVCSVQGKNAEHWQNLCAQAAVEQDPQKLMQLVEEITRLLDEKKNRLSSVQVEKQKAG